MKEEDKKYKKSIDAKIANNEGNPNLNENNGIRIKKDSNHINNQKIQKAQHTFER